MRWFTRWKPALRIARRDAQRARGRSILVIVMIGLPVLAIVSLDTLGRTADVSVREGLNRRLGAADAWVNFQSGGGDVTQNPTMTSWGSSGDQSKVTPPTTATLESILGPGSRVIDLTEGHVVVRTKVGIAQPGAVEVNLRDPMAKGLYSLNRRAASAHERRGRGERPAR
jgi:putative ABC transport system permease protein